MEKIMRNISIIFCLTFLNFNFLESQSLFYEDDNYVGDFISENSISNWYVNNSGSKTLEQNDVFNGQYSMKIETSSTCLIFNSSQVPFTKENGKSYNIGFYMKGKKGNTVTVSLKNSNIAPDESPKTIALRNNGWSFYRVILDSSSSSSDGAAKIKIKFDNPGYYYIDVISVSEYSNKTIYVSSINGSDNNDGTLNSPFKTIQKAVNSWELGDFIEIMQGEYNNNGYGNGSLYNGPVVNLNSNQITDANLYNPMVIKNYGNDRPLIKFDGSAGFNGDHSHIEISGLEISGINESITYNQAMNYRPTQNNYFSGRGISIWRGHHININNNIVHHTPNSGIRVNNGDYCHISYNTIYNTTWWSPNAESAIVYATVNGIDNYESYKMRMTGNTSFNNENRIPFHKFGNNQCSGFGYGCSNYNKFVDGNGVYVTRNNQYPDSNGDANPNHPDESSAYNGKFFIANNVSYQNGINGIVIHKTDNAVVVNNTVFANGISPLTSELGSNQPVWYQNVTQGRQGWSGITINNSKNITLLNNIISGGRNSDEVYKIVNSNGYVTNIKRGNNLIYVGKEPTSWTANNGGGAFSFEMNNPQFINENISTINLRLSENSPAIGRGVSNSLNALMDIDGNYRNPNSIDIGAYSYNTNFLSIVENSTKQLMFYPNPVKDIVIVPNLSSGVFKTFDIRGSVVKIGAFDNNNIDLSELNSGIYFMSINDNKPIKLIKL